MISHRWLTLDTPNRRRGRRGAILVESGMILMLVMIAATIGLYLIGTSVAELYVVDADVWEDVNQQLGITEKTDT